MKNTINYFYNLEPDNIHQQDKIFKFNIGNKNYVFLPCYRTEKEIDDLYSLSTSLLSQGIYCHQMILNNNSSKVTMVNNIPYILLYIYIIDSRNITYEDLVWFSNISMNSSENSLRRDQWLYLWSEKIDYFEYQVSQFGKTFPLLRESFSYFVGMTETGISFLKNINTNNKSLSLSHGRIKKDNTLFDLYNPLNFIIDSKTRDICEYFKSRFFDGENIIYDVIDYITSNNLNETDCLLLYARMFFPTFYFDVFELIVHNQLSEKEILKIIHKINDYELFLNKLHNYLKQIMSIPNIEWISKIQTTQRL